MYRIMTMGIVVTVCGLTSLPVASGRAETDAARLQELVQGARSPDAHERNSRDGQPDVDHFEGTARALLAVTLKSTDPTLRGFALRAAMQLREPQLGEGARTAARSADRYEQSLALEVLANSDPSGGRAEFLAALQSPFRGVRLRALRGLSKLKDPEVAERIGRIVTTDPDPDLRALAAQALADTGTAHAWLTLHQALDDEIFAVREQAVRALVRLGDAEVAPLMRFRLMDGAVDRRVQHLRLIALIPDASLVGDVGPFLADPEPEVRAFAAGAILSILEATEARR